MITINNNHSWKDKDAHHDKIIKKLLKIKEKHITEEPLEKSH